MEAYPVSKIVNKYENDTEACIAPITLDDNAEIAAEEIPKPRRRAKKVEAQLDLLAVGDESDGK